MSPSPIHKALSILQKHRVRALLMGGQACILYGAAEFSCDIDLAVLADDKNLSRLEGRLCVRAPIERRSVTSRPRVSFPIRSRRHARTVNRCDVGAPRMRTLRAFVVAAADAEAGWRGTPARARPRGSRAGQEDPARQGLADGSTIARGGLPSSRVKTHTRSVRVLAARGPHRRPARSTVSPVPANRPPDDVRQDGSSAAPSGRPRRSQAPAAGGAGALPRVGPTVLGAPPGRTGAMSEREIARRDNAVKNET